MAFKTCYHSPWSIRTKCSLRSFPSSLFIYLFSFFIYLIFIFNYILKPDIDRIASIRDPDIKLTELGRNQAIETGKYLAKTKPFDICLTSPYCRAIDTGFFLKKRSKKKKKKKKKKK